MFLRRRWIIGGLLTALIGCNQLVEGAEPKNGPAKIEDLGNGISRVTLTPKAVERLDIQTTRVQGEKGGGTKKIVPYSAVIYDPNGVAWTYTSPKPLVFVREKITIDRIDGNEVIIIEGPPVGTEVVIVGATELYGAETGIGK